MSHKDKSRSKKNGGRAGLGCTERVVSPGFSEKQDLNNDLKGVRRELMGY